MKMNGNTNQRKSGNIDKFNAHGKSLRRRKIDTPEEEDNVDPNVENLVKSVPEGTNKNPKFLKSLLDSVPNRLKNCVVRTIFAIAMISGFCLLIYGGPFTLMLLVYLIQVKCFQEIITIGYKVYNVQALPLFKWLSWYFLIASNYFLYGENLFDYLGVFFSRIEILRFMISYHRFLSFCFYGLGVVLFIVSLVKKYSMKQFILMGWTHTTLLIFVVVSYQVIQNIFEGLIWFVVPISMIIMNDIMAYIFGFFFGKTPLIQLSPKKTWEGFIGGGFATVVFGVILSFFLCQYQHFICPVEYSETAANFVMECEPSYIFQLQDYTINISSLGIFNTISMYPFVLHSLSMSIFSSVIGPFGGFFASGFKRAFKIKDFGDVIPGHGGITDRFDCQVLMGFFVNVYIYSFIRTPSPQKILAQITKLQPEQQLEFYYELKEHLESSF